MLNEIGEGKSGIVLKVLNSALYMVDYSVTVVGDR